MLCMVFYRPDGTVAINYPNEPFRNVDEEGVKETDVDFCSRVHQKDIVGTDLEDTPYDIMDSSALPTHSKEKWRGSQGSGVEIDNTVVTQAEQRAADAAQRVLDEDALDAAMEAISPEVATLQRKLRGRV